MCLVDEKQALKRARQSEKRWVKGEPIGSLDGVPALIKDLLLVKGWPTLRGSKTVDPDQPWDHDAPSVARLKEQGAILLGMTTTPEFGWKGVTDSPLTGITRNPVGPVEDARRLVGRIVGCARGGLCAADARHRWRRLDPHSGWLHRHLRPQAVLRPRAGLAALALRHRRACRADDAHGRPMRR